MLFLCPSVLKTLKKMEQKNKKRQQKEALISLLFSMAYWMDQKCSNSVGSALKWNFFVVFCCIAETERSCCGAGRLHLMMSMSHQSWAAWVW